MASEIMKSLWKPSARDGTASSMSSAVLTVRVTQYISFLLPLMSVTAPHKGCEAPLTILPGRGGERSEEHRGNADEHPGVGQSVERHCDRTGRESWGKQHYGITPSIRPIWEDDSPFAL